MLSMQPIGYVRSPYKDVREIPKGLGAQHPAEGVLEILAEFEPGLTDIEGFSHLFVIWAFDRAVGCDLVGTPPTDDRPHGVLATRDPGCFYHLFVVGPGGGAVGGALVGTPPTDDRPRGVFATRSPRRPGCE